MKTSLPLLAFCAATLTASTALPCSVAVPEPIAPSTWAQAEIPIDGVVYVDTQMADLLLPQALVDPNGEDVEWELETSDVHPDIQEATPVGGWVLGEYRFEDADPDAAATYTIVDEIDEQAPEFEIEGWSGNSEKYVLAPCGGGHQQSGVYVTLDEPEEPVIYRWEIEGLQDGDAATSGVFIGWGRFIPTQLGAEFDLSIEAVDLSGNSTLRTTEAVVACDGCSGSMSAGSATSALGLLGFLFLATRRRGASHGA